MKVLRKNVYLATKSICTSFATETLDGPFSNYIAKPLGCDIVLVKVGEDDYREATDLYEASNKLSPLAPKSAVLKVLMPKYGTEPINVGDIFVTNLRKIYTVDENNISKVDLKELDELSKNRTTTFDF